MSEFTDVAGRPTAAKDSGAEWYYPAVTCEFGRPRRLPHGNRHETRGKAKAEAKRMIDESR
jgi:hypothetical protein